MPYKKEDIMVKKGGPFTQIFNIQHFQSRVFKSSQNNIRPYIFYIIGKRMTSAMAMPMTMIMTKTNTTTKTHTKCLKDPSYAIFSKSREFKDIRYDAYNDKDNCQDKDKDKGAEKTQHMLYF